MLNNYSCAKVITVSLDRTDIKLSTKKIKKLKVLDCLERLITRRMAKKLNAYFGQPRVGAKRGQPGGQGTRWMTNWELKGEL